jgi:hypothetical protein
LSEPAGPTGEEFVRWRSRALTLYTWAGALSVIGIFLLAGYAIRLGPLVGPGVEDSFGLAVAVMFLLGALLVHLADRVYREWPFGRRIRPEHPAPVTDRSIATFVAWMVLVAGASAVAYVVWGLLNA